MGPRPKADLKLALLLASLSESEAWVLLLSTAIICFSYPDCQGAGAESGVYVLGR